jgi:hypothetical protein
MAQARLLLGISIFWLPLSMLSDGLTTLVQPRHLLGLIDDESKATTLGLRAPGAIRSGSSGGGLARWRPV